MEDYFKQSQLKKKKDAFDDCSESDCDHLKCELGQSPEGCTFRPIDSKAEKVRKVARFIDNIPIIGTGGNRMIDYLAYTFIVLFGLFFITGKESPRFIYGEYVKWLCLETLIVQPPDRGSLSL